LINRVFCSSFLSLSLLLVSNWSAELILISITVIGKVKFNQVSRYFTITEYHNWSSIIENRKINQESSNSLISLISFM
jgi:hypothetical protein